MSIAPISGAFSPQQITQPAVASEPKAGKNEFGDLLRDCLQRVDGDQSGAGNAIEDLLAGKSQGILPAVEAMAQADLSFKLLLGVRNKVIDAYKQTMNMQI
jgi:flagellar hook-basal body complex protein FliE